MKVRIAHIIDAAELVLDLPDGSIRSGRRFKPWAIARQIVMYVSFTRFNRTASQIGRVLQRDHSTVGWGIRVVSEQIKTDARLRETVQRIGDAAEKIAAGVPLERGSRETKPQTKKRKRFVVPTGLPPATAHQQPIEDWYRANDLRFCAAMRALYPNLEINTEGRGRE